MGDGGREGAMRLCMLEHSAPASSRLQPSDRILQAAAITVTGAGVGRRQYAGGHPTHTATIGLF